MNKKSGKRKNFKQKRSSYNAKISKNVQNAKKAVNKKVNKKDILHTQFIVCTIIMFVFVSFAIFEIAFAQDAIQNLNVALTTGPSSLSEVSNGEEPVIVETNDAYIPPIIYGAEGLEEATSTPQPTQNSEPTNPPTPEPQ